MDAIRWLRISYWAGAVTAAAAAQMLYPPLFGFGMGLPAFHPGADYRYAMGMGASLMLGWTALLLWADRKPLQRKSVLLLTVFPVIVGLAANEACGVAAAFVRLGAMLPILALQGALSALFLVSYWRARRISQAVEQQGTLMGFNGEEVKLAAAGEAMIAAARKAKIEARRI